MFGIDQAIASVSLSGTTPIGMFKCSANRSTFFALPLAPKSLKMLIASRAASSLFAGNGYSMLFVTHNRPCASNFKLMGL